MFITQISTTTTQKTHLFSADFVFDKPYGGRKEKIIFWCKWIYHAITNPIQTLKFGFKVRKRIWYEVPTEFINKNSAWDAFYIIALPLAIALNEDLIFDGKVSLDLLKKTREIENYYHEVSKRKIKIKTRIEKNSEKNSGTNRLAAQFFTLGVDSFYTLYCLDENRQHQNSSLIYVDGYDIPFYQKQFLKIVHQKIDQVALKNKKQSIFVSTNLRTMSDSIIGWGRFHVTALVAVHHLLKSSHVFISGESFEASDWGLRFGVDNLYSTKEKKVELVGHNISREKKLEKILDTNSKSIFLENVRVCWENVRGEKLIYNCSECQKCFKTKLSLMSLGVMETPTFLPIKTESLEKIHLVGHVYEEWQQLYQNLKKIKNIDKNILSAIEKVLEKPLRV